MLISVRNAATSVRAEVPDDWFFTERAVPNLVVPRELFLAATSILPRTPGDTSQPRPLVQALTRADVVVWCYVQRPDDPDRRDPAQVPDYGANVPPLRYSATEVFPSTDAREWDPSSFLWRRTGFKLDESTVTVWIWEGTGASDRAIREAVSLVGSIEP
jgi:hypothetical protein